MTDWLDIGPTPPGESCAQLGSDNYIPRARCECRSYIAQLRRVIGPEPAGARLVIKSHQHDFGAYLSVACEFDTDNQPAVEYAYRCESDGPDEWDDQAKAELHRKEAFHGNVD